MDQKQQQVELEMENAKIRDGYNVSVSLLVDRIFTDDEQSHDFLLEVLLANHYINELLISFFTMADRTKYTGINARIFNVHLTKALEAQDRVVLERLFNSASARYYEARGYPSDGVDKYTNSYISQVDFMEVMHLYRLDREEIEREFNGLEPTGRSRTYFLNASITSGNSVSVDKSGKLVVDYDGNLLRSSSVVDLIANGLFLQTSAAASSHQPGRGNRDSVWVVQQVSKTPFEYFTYIVQDLVDDDDGGCSRPKAVCDLLRAALDKEKKMYEFYLDHSTKVKP